MISDANGKPETRADAEQVAKLLEIELAHKKLQWATASRRAQKIRAASFFFLALIIIGALAAFFLLFSRLPSDRSSRPASAESPGPSN